MQRNCLLGLRNFHVVEISNILIINKFLQYGSVTDNSEVQFTVHDILEAIMDYI